MFLAALVDECCDPTCCEYASAQMGGLMVMRVTAAKWPFQSSDAEAATGLEEATLSQQWEDDLSAGSGLEWKSLASAAMRLLGSARKTDTPVNPEAATK